MAQEPEKQFAFDPKKRLQEKIPTMLDFEDSLLKQLLEKIKIILSCMRG